MKVFVISVFCALVGHAVGGAISWPAAAVRTIIPGETKTTAYSATQYINALPTSYSFGAQPQLVYQVPQVNSIAQLPSGYYSLASPSYVPATNFIYPGQASFVPALGVPSIAGGHIIPAVPSAPSSPNPFPSNPAPPLGPQPEPAGDSDSAVIESADFIGEQQNQQGLQPSFSSSSIPAPQPTIQQFASNNFPSFPTIPQIPQGQSPSFPSFPQLPQIPQIPQQPQQGSNDFLSSSQGSQLASFPSIPQIPQNLQGSASSSPSYPQTSQMTQPGQVPEQNPTFPQYPPLGQQPNFPQNVFPQGPFPSSPTSFPGAGNNNSGLSDNDTVTVESA